MSSIQLSSSICCILLSVACLVSGAVIGPSQFPFLVPCLIHQAITLQPLGREEKKYFKRNILVFRVYSLSFCFVNALIKELIYPADF